MLSARLTIYEPEAESIMYEREREREREKRENV
jgi:hypothetical protein